MNPQIIEAPTAQPIAKMPGYWACIRWPGKEDHGPFWRVIKETKTGVRAVPLHGVRFGHLPCFISRKDKMIRQANSDEARVLDESHGELLRSYIGTVWGTLFARKS